MAPKKNPGVEPTKRKSSHPAGPSPAKPQPAAKAPNLNNSSLGPDLAALQEADSADREIEHFGGAAAAGYLDLARDLPVRVPRTSTPLDLSAAWRDPRSPASVNSSSDELQDIEEEEESELPYPPDYLQQVAFEETQEDGEALGDDLLHMSVDEPHLEAVVMAQAASDPEVLMRTDIENDISFSHDNLTAAGGGRVVRTKKVVEALGKKITELNRETMKRIAKIKVEATKVETLRVWRDVHNKLLDDHEAVEELLAVKEGRNSAALLDEKKAEIQSRIDRTNAEVVAIMDKWALDHTRDTSDDKVITRALYVNFKERISDIKKMIRPALQQLFEELAAADISQRNIVNNSYGTMVKNLDDRVAGLLDTLHKSKMEDATLSFHPALDSTRAGNLNTSGASNSGSSSHVTNSANSFAYLKREMPKFTGQAGKYAKWKKEMLRDVMPGKSVEQQIRLIAELSPNPEVEDMFETTEETWAYMDDEHANKTAVSKEITTNFLAVKSIPGLNDQQKLVNLYQKIKEMRLTLKNLGRETQLTDVDNMLGKAIQLLPDRYSEEYNIKQLEEEEQSDRALTDKEKYENFEAWMAKRAKYLKSTMSHLLKKEKAEVRFEEKKTRKEREKEDAMEKLIRKQANLLEQLQDQVNQTNLGQKAPGKRTDGAGVSDGQTRRIRVSEANTPLPAHSREVREQLERKWANYGPCPCCGNPGHQFEGFKGWTASQSMQDCPRFMNDLTVEQRADFVCKTKKSCIRCLSFTHNTRDCPKLKDEWYCRVMENGQMCKGEHSNFLHGLPAAYKLANAFRKGDLAGSVDSSVLEDLDSSVLEDLADEELENLEILRRDSMLAVVLHFIGGVATIILLDGGSTCSIITNRHARRLGLVARLFNTNIKVLGKPMENVDLRYYAFTMQTDFGPKKLVLLGMDSLTEIPGEYSVDVAYELFPHLRPGCLEKPNGEVDILIGQDNVDLLPKGGDGPDLVDGLMVQSIPFGPGKVLTGYHPDISFTNPVLSNTVKAAYHVDISRPSSKSPICLGAEEQDINFYEAEMMPFNPPARCSSCMTCKHCTMQREGVTVKEKLELQDMQDNIWHDPVEKTLTCSYPFAKDGDIRAFRDNRHQALQRAESSYNSLKKKGKLDEFQEQWDDYIARGVLEEVTLEGIQDWKEQGGYVHYVATHGVVNEKSISTKLRVVVDSSLKNCYTGPRLTDLYAKGPNTINDLYTVLVRWRSFYRAGIFDLKKAYHSIRTTLKEFFMRLVVWKDPETGEWRTWGHKRVGMGDISAAAFLELGKGKASELARLIDILVAEQLLSMSYVDDGLVGGTQEELERMRGTITYDDKGKPSFSGTVNQSISQVGFKEKNFTLSGDTDPRILDNQGERVLGVEWRPTEDKLVFKLKLRLPQKDCRGRVAPDLMVDTVEVVDSTIFTRRKCLQMAAQIFDPIGLLCAYTVRFKILQRDIIAHELGWDDVLPDDMQEQWKELLREVVALPELTFPRTITAELVIGRPELIVYSDGSNVAFGAVIYIRWVLQEVGKFHTALVTSKSRVTPKTGLTAPRSELQGLVVATRLTNAVMKALDVKPKRITMLTDSQCSVAACSKNANSLAVFFSNRVIEITAARAEWGSDRGVEANQELTIEQEKELEGTDVVVDLFNHTPGVVNPADGPTRGNLSWEDMKEDGEHQVGPAYIRLDRAEWPVSRDFVTEVPVEERRKKFTVVQQSVNLCNTAFVHSLQISSDTWPIFRKAEMVMALCDGFLKVKSIMGRICRALRLQDKFAVFDTLQVQDLAEAEWFFALSTMRSLHQHSQKKGGMDSLTVFWRGGLCRTRGRLSPEDMAASMGHESLVVIPESSRLAFLVMTESHAEDHRSAGDTLWRSRRRGYWIIRGRVLAKRVADKCLVCRRIRARMEQQVMADLPHEIFQIPCKAFSRVQIDYAGAVMVKDEFKRRTQRKCFPLLFVCLNSGGLHIQLATGYSAEEFLVQLQFFAALRGDPVYIHTDMGSQLVSAGKALVEGDKPNFPWDEITSSEKTRGMEFIHCPTQSQWRNGKAESAVRAMKNTLKHLVPGHQLTYSEFSCLLARAANKVNQRPLGVRHHGGAEGEVCVITPHMLMSGGLVCQGQEHGRALNKDISKLDFRMRMVEDCFALWWKNWMIQVWESLVPVDKWRTVHRNVQVGDIVLVRYTSKVTKPEFRLGRISDVFPDAHGVVRDVQVITRSRRGKLEDLLEYKPRKFDEQKLPVQRLAVLLPLEEQGGLPPADEALHVCEEDMRVPNLADVFARPAPTGPHGPTDPSLNVPPTPEDAEDTEARAEVPASTTPTGPTGPTDSDLNVPPTPTETEDTAEAMVYEPTQLVVDVRETEEGLQSHGVFQVMRTDTQDFITKLVNHAAVVRSPQYYCSDCQVRHIVSYNEGCYKQSFESEN